MEWVIFVNALTFHLEMPEYHGATDILKPVDDPNQSHLPVSSLIIRLLITADH